MENNLGETLPEPNPKVNLDTEEEIHVNLENPYSEIACYLIEIKEMLEKGLLVQSFKDETIARMSKQIESHEQDILWKSKQPILKEIITLYDSVDRLCVRFNSMYDGQIGQEMEVLKEEIESILYRHDIEVLALGESNKMDTQLHKVIKREITLEENLANTVVIVRQGLTYQGTIIRKHEVILRTLTND